MVNQRPGAGAGQAGAEAHLKIWLLLVYGSSFVRYENGALTVVMADPGNYPVLVHCFAGIHRTGAYCAVYRMEFERWDNADAMAVGEGSVWVATNHYPEGGHLFRIDPRTNRVVATIRIGNRPQGIAAGQGAVWVAVG